MMPDYIHRKVIDKPKKPLSKRLSDTASKVYEWMDETEGDARELLVTAWEALSDAAEVLRDD